MFEEVFLQKQGVPSVHQHGVHLHKSHFLLGFQNIQIENAAGAPNYFKAQLPALLSVLASYFYEDLGQLLNNFVVNGFKYFQFRIGE